MTSRILIVEDDPVIRGNVLELLTEEGFEAIAASDGADGVALAKARGPDLVICDITLPKLDGYGVLHSIREDPRIASKPFIFLTAKAERADVRTGMNLGADDYLSKPFTASELLETVRTRLHRAEEIQARTRSALERENKSAPEATLPVFSPADGVVILDPKMRELYAEVARAAAASIKVLILGENGVGKEILARAIHNLSPRAKGPFVALNCAALGESLLEAELFGHEKGAFTGALQARAGLIETAEGGTLFLDEIGELPASIQATLLRTLEDRKVRRVGARVEREVDVRFISATNRDLEASTEQGSFRQDLYFRLSTISFTIPPLRTRPSEIPALCRVFLARSSAEQGRSAPLALGDDALSVLLAYSWPGNVRELRNVIERGVVLCAGDVLHAEHLPPRLVRSALGGSTPLGSDRPADTDPPQSPCAGLDESLSRAQNVLSDAKRKHVMDALERCGHNQTRAAEMLGVSRRTLVYWLSQLGLPRPRKP